MKSVIMRFVIKLLFKINFVRRLVFMFYFFFFFNKLTENPIVKKAFETVCINKLKKDYYCDMSEYIFARINKSEMYASLSAMESPFAYLYKNSYPKLDVANEYWRNFLENNSVYYNEKTELSVIESKAIAYWIYRIYSNSEERKNATRKMLSELSNYFELGTLSFAQAIIYIKSKVEINLITSFDKANKIIQTIGKSGNSIYYRGHSDANYVLLPSVMRLNSWYKHECDLYNETVIECPNSFKNCFTHLDYLVEMQHYGLPTRLLDVTKNPLVALYFACCDNFNSQGELIVFDVKTDEIKYPKSDTVSILASLPLFKSDMKKELLMWAQDKTLDINDFNRKAIRLLHEVKLEKPAFRDEIAKNDILSCFFVLAEKKNDRIVKQDGAFIICGLFDLTDNIINKYRYKKHTKIQIYIIDQKAKMGILKQLDKFSINRAQLFPEISDVTEHIKEKYK